MAEAKYPCPQCQATLKLKQEVPPGKKIKCPKCEAVFAPVAAAAKPKPAPARTADDDDEDSGGTFGFKEEAPSPKPKDEDDDDGDEPKSESMLEEVQERLRKRFPKSKRGPAQAIVMKCSNQLLATASLTCVSCIVSVVVALWPMVFSLEKKLTSEEMVANWMVIGFCVVAFLYNGAITYGAVMLQSVESLTWATIASVMMLLPTSWVLAAPAYYWFLTFVYSITQMDEFRWGTLAVISIWFLYVGSWNLVTIRKPEVLEGFGEKREKY